MDARAATPWILALALLVPAPVQAGREVPLYLFYAEGCTACIQEKAFLQGLGERVPELRVRLFEAQFSAANGRLLARAAGLFDLQPSVVPVTFVGAFGPIVGFRDDATTGALIEQRVRRCAERGCDDPVAALLAGDEAGAARMAAAGAGAREAGEGTMALPLVGETDLSRLPLVALSVVLGGLDSFNPCAFFVLFSLLGILVHARSRRRMLAVGGTFVLCSGLLYFAFMAAWLNVFLHLGELRAVTVAAGCVALAMAAINIKDYFFFKRGVSLSIPESRKPRLFERMRGLLRESSPLAMLLGTVVLALAANTYELLCTAGFPMVFTRILTLHRLPAAEYYLYLGLYNLVYVVPLAAVVGVFALTLGSRKLSEEQGRAMKLVSGLMMLGLGTVVLVEPSLFNNALSGVLLLALALLAAAAIVGVSRLRQRAGRGHGGARRGAFGRV